MEAICFHKMLVYYKVKPPKRPPPTQNKHNCSLPCFVRRVASELRNRWSSPKKCSEIRTHGTSHTFKLFWRILTTSKASNKLNKLLETWSLIIVFDAILNQLIPVLTLMHYFSKISDISYVGYTSDVNHVCETKKSVGQTGICKSIQTHIPALTRNNRSSFHWLTLQQQQQTSHLQSLAF
jgi:hypothetical protein